MTRYVLTTEAQQDVRAIRAFLTERGGPRLARYVLSALVVGFRKLSSNPGIGHVRDDLTRAQDVRFWPVFSYLIVYKRESRPLGIVAVVHGKRDVQAILHERL